MQDRLQRELDAVVPLSSGRLPDLSDEPNLPYMEAFTLKVMRCKTLVPLLQHATLRDTEVDGCFIPENTSVRIIMMSLLYITRNSSGDEVANVNFFTTTLYTH